MVVKCNQTTHQKETINLIKDFFESADNIPNTTNWGTGIISILFGITGIKFNKPFMAEVFEGNFTTNSLLKKYPINKSQVMYIFTIHDRFDVLEEKIFYDVKATRVYNSGKVFIDDSRGRVCLSESRDNEKYFNFNIAPTYDDIWDYDMYENHAIKTLVLVADTENVVKMKHRKPTSEKEDDLIQYAVNDYGSAHYKTNRFEWVEREDNTDWITLREGSGKKYEYQNSDYCEHFDKSGYCVEAFRQFLFRRLEKYNAYLNLKEVIKAGYSQVLQARYDEIIMLKNLIATNTINNTDLKTLQTLSYLTDKIVDVIGSHEDIMNKLKRSREVYENCKHKLISTRCGIYSKVAKVEENLKDLDSSIMKIRTELSDKILQQDT